MNKYITQRIKNIKKYITPNQRNLIKLNMISKVLQQYKIGFITGNGGSAAIASHVAEDFTKIAKIPIHTFNDIALMSCFANDYGWDNYIKKIIQKYNYTDCFGIFISSSGKSKNIINGCLEAKKRKIFTITFTGFEYDNPLSQIGNINIYIPCNKYNIIESIHEIWLLSICDYIGGKDA